MFQDRIVPPPSSVRHANGSAANQLAAPPVRLSWSLCFSYMAGIYWLSSMSHINLPRSLLYYDFFLHALLYAILGGLLSWALLSSGAKNKSYLWAVLIAILYGASDELHQAFVPGRIPDFRDLLADGLGSAIGAAFVYIWHWGRREF
jgi:VanZ family protein